jgi:LysM repeat protein
MVYPSHWGAGEYGVADPVHQPSEIVAASLADFARIAAGSGAAVVPWLQDFSIEGAPYGPNEVRAQIDAAASAGSKGFLLWNPGSAYHADALTRLKGESSPTEPTTIASTAGGSGPPSVASSGPPAAPARFHRVRQGDTLTAIAAEYVTDIATIMALNAISDPDALRVGQVLQLPPAPG